MAKVVFDDVEVKDKAEVFFQCNYEYDTEKDDGKLIEFDEFKNDERFIEDMFDEYYYEIALTDKQWRIIYDIYVINGREGVMATFNKKKLVETGAKLLRLARELGLTPRAELEEFLSDYSNDYIY